MRAFTYSYRTITGGSILESSGTCLQVAKGVPYFSYSFNQSDIKPILDFKLNERLSSKETLEFTCGMVEAFIQEVNLGVEFTYDTNNFEFETTEFCDWNISADRVRNAVYSCMILSRLCLSGETKYERLLNIMYYLITYRGYTVFESYIIGSSHEGNGYYSFTDLCILDLNAYKELKDKSILFDSNLSSGLNTDIHTALKFKRLNTATPQTEKTDLSFIENHYFDTVEQLESLSMYFVKINKEYLKLNLNMLTNKLLGSMTTFILGARTLEECYLLTSWGQLEPVSRLGMIKNNKFNSQLPFAYNVNYDQLYTLIKPIEFLQLYSKEILSGEKVFMNKLNTLFESKYMNLKEYIEKSGILNQKSSA